MTGGAFSIQPLEGSRFGTFELWVLNGWESGEGWKKRGIDCSEEANPCAGVGLVRTWDHQVGAADTRVALVWRQGLES
jgi:hypothetical protein